MSNCVPHIGSRVWSEGFFATVKFVGVLPNVKGWSLLRMMYINNIKVNFPHMSKLLFQAKICFIPFF